MHVHLGSARGEHAPLPRWNILVVDHGRTESKSRSQGTLFNRQALAHSIGGARVNRIIGIGFGESASQIFNFGSRCGSGRAGHRDQLVGGCVKSGDSTLAPSPMATRIPDTSPG